MRSVFILFGLLLLPLLLFGDNIEQFKCYPMPFSPFEGSGTLSLEYSLRYTKESEVNIKIFTLTGELVYSKVYPVGSGDATAGISLGTRTVEDVWDGKNKDGRYVADGGYILQFKATPVTGGEEVKYVKILVIKDK